MFSKILKAQAFVLVQKNWDKWDKEHGGGKSSKDAASSAAHAVSDKVWAQDNKHSGAMDDYSSYDDHKDAKEKLNDLADAHDEAAKIHNAASKLYEKGEDDHEVHTDAAQEHSERAEQMRDAAKTPYEKYDPGWHGMKESDFH